MPLQPLPPDGLVSGFLDADDSNELISLECGGSGSESVYQIVIDDPISLVATTVFEETEIDTVLSRYFALPVVPTATGTLVTPTAS